MTTNPSSITDQQITDYLNSKTVEWLLGRVYEHNLNADDDWGSSALFITEIDQLLIIPVNEVLGVIFKKLGRSDLVLREEQIKIQ